MKHLLSGIAIAAALAVAAPTWAQAPPGPPAGGGTRVPSGPPPAAAAPAPAAMAPMAPMAPRAGKQRKKRMKGAMAGKSSRKMSGDQMTQQLNREELARLQGGAPPAAAHAPAGRMPMGGPPTGGSAPPR